VTADSEGLGWSFSTRSRWGSV